MAVYSQILISPCIFSLLRSYNRLMILVNDQTGLCCVPRVINWMNVRVLFVVQNSIVVSDDDVLGQRFTYENIVLWGDNLPLWSCVPRIISLFGSVSRVDYCWVLNSDWDQRSAKQWSHLYLASVSNGAVFADLPWPLRLQGHSVTIGLDAVDMLCAPLMHDLFAIAKFVSFGLGN